MSLQADQIIRSRRKTLSLEIRPDARLVVRAPWRLADSVIEDFVAQKKSWILKKQNWVREKLKSLPPRRFVNGETFLYRGQSYPLQIVPGQRPPLIFNGVFQLSEKARERAKEMMAGWYRDQARSLVHERAQHYSKIAGLVFENIRITGARSRWGSCGPGGRLCFSWRLAMVPRPVLDYVVVHELVHLVEKNHSRRFWKKVEELFPDYPTCRRWLQENEPLTAL